MGDTDGAAGQARRRSQKVSDPLHGLVPDPACPVRAFKIGCIGAGFIMADIHLMAYERAGFEVACIASRTVENARAVAKKRNIPKVHPTPEALIEDSEVAILDLAFPPHLQPALIDRACGQPHIKAILAQKPLAMDYPGARDIVARCRDAGKILSVNQNMRFDQSMRVLKQLLDRGDLGTPVTATIEMRAIPHWQPFLADYDRLTLLNMSIHHLDVLRFHFGEARSIYTAVRPDPRTRFAHRDGICVSTIEFEGPIAVSMEDVWTGPKTEGSGDFEPDLFIKWRVEGLDGIAEGTIGWPDYPDGSPSTLRFASHRTTGGRWVTPSWTTRWFPDAFAGVMGQLQEAVAANTTPMLSGATISRPWRWSKRATGPWRSTARCRPAKS